MAEHFYPPTNERQALGKVLGEVPETVENLARCMTIGIRAQTFEPRVTTGDRPQPLPFAADADEVAEDLRQELMRWVKWLCEVRRITHPRFDILPMARFLNQYILILATTPGSETANTSISAKVKAAQRTSGRSIRAQPKWDENKLESARALRLPTGGIAQLGREMGIQGLTRKRINNLKTLGHVNPVETVIIGRIELFVFGEVLDAHNDVERRVTESA
ncbi:hypothetical protein R3Q06_18030 [Rhodococcus erythropolis]|uniref:hypothetical protein n=1 Tax=Rhodococcus erythropolis TaxID=1833 RepID=UPI00294A24B7|nr:hypothetical protein [Rhodococcus erythropolis]MDV6275397.1 hypothetical protein [Rhodococcus erythropolis]